MNERRPHGRFNRSVAGSQRQTTAFVRWRINGHRTAYIGFNLDTWAGIVAPTGTLGLAYRSLPWHSGWLQ